MSVSENTDISSSSPLPSRYTFTGLGLHPGMGSTHYLPRLIGHQQAARLLLTGEVVSGAEAARYGNVLPMLSAGWFVLEILCICASIGLVLEALPSLDQATARATSLANAMIASGPVAVRGCVRSLRMKLDVGLEE